MEQNKQFTNEYIIGKSIFKKDEKLLNLEYFDRSILNLMIINNYHQKNNNKKLKKQINNNSYI
tara:strand:+ start:1025 stop:1213 length:189 start_codon:yes stop_codon:yes gene_type:complete